MLLKVIDTYIDEDNNELLICRDTKTVYKKTYGHDSPFHRDLFCFKIKIDGKVVSTSRYYRDKTLCLMYGEAELEKRNK